MRRLLPVQGTLQHVDTVRHKTQGMCIEKDKIKFIKTHRAFKCWKASSPGRNHCIHSTYSNHLAQPQELRMMIIIATLLRVEGLI